MTLSTLSIADLHALYLYCKEKRDDYSYKGSTAKEVERGVFSEAEKIQAEAIARIENEIQNRMLEIEELK